MAYSYQVEFKEVGGSVTRVEGITQTEYAVTGLIDSTDYEWRVRQIDDSAGIITWSLWSAWQSYTTAVDSAVTFTINAATETNNAPNIALNIFADTTDPVITIIGDNPYLLPINETYVELGASATDDTDGDITGSVSVSGTVDNTTTGIYQIQYDVSDASGNSATAIREVHVAVPLAPTSWNLEYREVGQASVLVEDINQSEYAFTGGSESTTYEWRVQGKNGSKVGNWTNFVQFQTVSTPVTFSINAATETSATSGMGFTTPVTLTLNSASEANSAPAITFSNGNAIKFSLNVASETDTAQAMAVSTPVIFALNTATETGTAPSLLLNISSPITFSLNVATETNTAPGFTTSTPGGTGEVPATSWDVEIENLITNAVTTVSNIPISQYQAVFTPHTPFRWRVQGKNGSDKSAWSDWSPAYITNGESVFLVTNESGGGALDVFSITFADLITGDDVTDLYGEISDGQASISVTFEGSTIPVWNRNGVFRANLNLGNRLGAAQIDELSFADGLILSGDMQVAGDDGFTINI